MIKKYLNKYNDGLLFLFFIPVINTINYHLTYSRVRWDWYTYATYAIDTASGFIAWWIIRKTILWLDRKMPYEKALLKRIGWQIVLTNLFAQGFIILATEFVNELYTDQPLPTKFYTYNLFIFFIWILVINGVYIGFYFHDQWNRTMRLREDDRQLRATGYEVQLGKRIETIPFENIAAFYVEDGTTFLKTTEQRNYVMDRSLNKIIIQIPSELFFRLNRKYIVHRAMLRGYTRGINGKLKASLISMEQLPETVTISRITAPEFKKWFRATTDGA
jgi:DNA-binding LytR/AlgR family response regulator